MLDELLPAARLAEDVLYTSLAGVIFKEHLVEGGIAHLHVDQELVVFIRVGLHALMPLLKLVVVCSEFF